MNSEEKLLSSLPKEMKEFIEVKRKWIVEKEKTPTDLSPNTRIFCNSCNRDTNHVCKFNSRKYHLLSSEKHVSFWTLGHQLWMCAGCETFTFETYDITEFFDFDENTAEDEPDPFEGSIPNPDITRDYFPKRTKHELIAKRYNQMPERLTDIYQEIIMAFNNELPLLCATGIRALIEGICFDYEVVGKNLEKKIEGLESILPKNIVTNLHNLRFMGNEAAHELSAPSKEEIQLAIEICEDLLNFLYELDYKASYLNKMRHQKSIGNDNDPKVTVWC
jgi:hypothetical protein